MCLFISCEAHHACRLSIYTVHDPQFAMFGFEYGLHGWLLGIKSLGYHGQPAWLVCDQDIIIYVYDRGCLWLHQAANLHLSGNCSLLHSGGAKIIYTVFGDIEG